MKKLALIWLLGWYLFCCAAFWIKIPFDLPRTLEFGHDAFGRSLFWLVPQASFISSLLALGLVALILVLSSVLGSLLALAPQTPAFWVGRILDFSLSFPSLLISITLSAFFRPGWLTLSTAILLGTMPSTLRMAQVRALEIIQEDFIHSSKALGATSFHMTLRHLLPHLWNWLSVKIPHLIASCILAEATLTLLGLGSPLGQNTWGALILQGKDYLLEAPWICASSCIPLFFTLLALQSVLKKSTAE